MSLVPGMFDKPLGELDSYVPLASASKGGPSGGAGLVWMKNDYKSALEKARAENKLVFVNFTGYACTNCHWMWWWRAGRAMLGYLLALALVVTVPEKHNDFFRDFRGDTVHPSTLDSSSMNSDFSKTS